MIRGLSGFDEDYYEYFRQSLFISVKFFLRVIVDVVVPLRLWPLSQKKVLELGCGKGELILVLRALGIKAYGVDISQAAAKHWKGMRQRYCIIADCFDPPFSERFDFVITQDLLEHLYLQDVLKALKVISNLCGGRMLHFITTTEDAPWIDLDATHRTKKQSRWWQEKFQLFGWETILPIKRRKRSGYYLLKKRSK